MKSSLTRSSLFRQKLHRSFGSISGQVRQSSTLPLDPSSGVISRVLKRRLRAEGLEAELLVMQSSGGVFTFAAASEKPVFMVESGSAAGVIAATYLGTTLDCPDVISFDMGGTTAKAGTYPERHTNDNQRL